MKEIKEGDLVKGISRSGRVCYGVYGGGEGDMYRLLPYMDSPYPVYCTEIQKLHLMPELPEGVNIGDEVEFSLFGQSPYWKKAKLSTMTIDGQFVCEDSEFWNHCRPINGFLEDAE